MLPAQDELKRTADRLLSGSMADHCAVKIDGSDDANLRFARGSATTNGRRGPLRVTVESPLGQRTGAASVTGLDGDALEDAVRRSERIAQSAPENPELMPPLGPQTYAPGAGYDAPTAAVGVGDLAAASRPVLAEADRQNVDVAGYGVARQAVHVLATSTGLFAHDRQTGAEFTVTARNRAGTWSGWAGVSETRFGRLDPAQLGRRAIDKAAYTAPPVRLDPGKYTVILEPSAVSDFVGYMFFYMNARPADEGRSFF